MNIITRDDLLSQIGNSRVTSDWLTIDQARIQAFADVTEDQQFIHVDEEAAKATPFGGTVAHGFLTLSMLSKLAGETLPMLEGLAMGVNYGFDKVRFINPVRAGKRIRGHFALKAVKEPQPGTYVIRYEVEVEIEGEAKPALAAEWLTMQVTS